MNEQTHNDPEWTLGDRIAKARRSAFISRATLAKQMGVSLTTLARWEADKSPVRFAFLLHISHLTGVKLSWLTDGEQ